jgi:hypothetical protein
MDMRETAQAYYIDIELPGLHNASALKVGWRSDHGLLVEGSLERPSIAKPKGSNGTENARDLDEGATNEAPSYIVADEANGFEPNKTCIHQTALVLLSGRQMSPSSYVVRDEANGLSRTRTSSRLTTLAMLSWSKSFLKIPLHDRMCRNISSGKKVMASRRTTPSSHLTSWTVYNLMKEICIV